MSDNNIAAGYASIESYIFNIHAKAECARTWQSMARNWSGDGDIDRAAHAAARANEAAMEADCSFAVMESLSPTDRQMLIARKWLDTAHSASIAALATY